MGNFIKIKCDCGEEQFFTIGIGFLSCFNEVAFEQIKKEKKYRNLNDFVFEPSDIINAEKRLYHCKKCGHLETHLYFELLKKPEYRLKFNCQHCNQRLAHVKNEVPLFTKKMLVSCPKCKKADIVNTEHSNIELGFWD